VVVLLELEEKTHLLTNNQTPFSNLTQDGMLNKNKNKNRNKKDENFRNEK
jgi:hypothetical protein